MKAEFEAPVSHTVCAFALAALATACGGSSGDARPAAAEPLSGGDTTVFDRSSEAFTYPSANLDADDLSRHLEGDAAFRLVFVPAPDEDNSGLGPLFSNTSCAGCHPGNGRGRPMVGADTEVSELLIRVSLPAGVSELPGGPAVVPGVGTQIQDRAVAGVEPEASVEIDYVERSGVYPRDGEPYSLRLPVPRITQRDGSPLPRHVLTSARIPPPMIGLGLLEAVPEETLRDLADPFDENGDGISGRINLVWSRAFAASVVGRFGWKASGSTLLDQAAQANAEDIGVTSPLLPEPDGGSEIDMARLATTAFFLQTIAVPARSSVDDPEVLRGEELFRDIGCAACHVEQLETGDHEIEALRYQTIHPYTDLLLHDVGFDLTDGRSDFEAIGVEWRTAPLWGIGLAKTVLPSAAFLHDGRARTLAEAILWHGGEAEAAREGFRTLSATERAALLAFLGSL